MIWEVVFSEVLGAINWGLWFVGLFVVTCGPMLIGYTMWTSSKIDIGEYRGEGSTYHLIEEDPPAGSPVGSVVVHYRSTGDILDQCLTHQSKLRYYHRILCERCGVDPHSYGPMTDLISEAVYDGRNHFVCIKRVDEAAREMAEQHA